MTVSELGERAVLAVIQARLHEIGRPAPDVVIGIGDDAAVVSATRNAQTVITTDAQVEGVHFERRFSAPADIGYRALAINLSDLAAMGARPRWALLSLAMPDALLIDDVAALVDGLVELARVYGIRVIGGNLARSPGPLVVDLTAVGELRPRRILSRCGGRPGDGLYVSGTIGSAAAGLAMLRDGRGTGSDDIGIAGCIGRYRRPEPRIRLGLAMSQAKAARAAIDLSDGLADAARQLAEASGCGVEIDADSLPIDATSRAWWAAADRDAVVEAIAGGDDYELLFAVPRAWGGRLRHARSRVAEPGLTRVGVLTKDPAERVLVRNGRRETLPIGYAHWSENAGVRT